LRLKADPVTRKTVAGVSVVDKRHSVSRTR
jgi:hypothetical protein